MGKSIGELNHDNLSISPKYRVADWVNARDAKNWDEMINIFHDRIESRYLKPVRLIAADKEIGEFSGFSILALDCLIIETLSQFYSGSDETQGEHKKAFWTFFKSSDRFKGSFSKAKAFTFYSHYRCGILHQAQTKLKSVVRMDQEEMIKTVGAKVSDGLVVDRVIFHSALECEITDYKNRLQNGSKELRTYFISKMNFICGI